MGTSGGAGIQFFNRTDAVVDGDLSFAGGDDDLFFFADSTVTGGINGGGGVNNLTLNGASGSDDTLRGDIAGFATLTKTAPAAGRSLAASPASPSPPCARAPWP